MKVWRKVSAADKVPYLVSSVFIAFSLIYNIIKKIYIYISISNQQLFPAVLMLCIFPNGYHRP